MRGYHVKIRDFSLTTVDRSRRVSRTVPTSTVAVREEMGRASGILLSSGSLRDELNTDPI